MMFNPLKKIQKFQEDQKKMEKMNMKKKKNNKNSNSNNNKIKIIITLVYPIPNLLTPTLNATVMQMIIVIKIQMDFLIIVRTK